MNESPRSVLKITVWMVIGCDVIIGACFVENDDSRTVTVDQINYRREFKEFYLLELRQKARRRDNRIQVRTQWLRQDGTPHTARTTREIL